MLPAYNIYYFFALFIVFLIAILSLTLNTKSYGEGYPSTVLKNELLPEGVLVTKSLINSPMPKLRQSQLGKILTRFYMKSLGGPDNWNTVNSYKVSGELFTVGGIRTYESIYKNPNFFRITTSSGKKKHVVTSNGVQKWEKYISEVAAKTTEIDSEINQTIYEPELISYLLYPFQKNKTYKYNGVIRESNEVCHIVSVSTGKGNTLDYFIDIEFYNIISVKITNSSNKFAPVLIKYADYRDFNGLHFPHKISTFIDGQWDSRLEVKEISTNVGVVDWMFYFRNDEFY